MLSESTIDRILDRLGSMEIAVLGDLFLDRYLDIDATLTEPSLETGLDAYQVVKVRSSPGAAGTVVSNLVALGVGRVVPIAVIGDDGEGYELRQALGRPGVSHGSPLPWTRGRGVGGEGVKPAEAVTPSPQPLSPEYRGEGLAEPCPNIIDCSALFADPSRRTPTYTKPMLHLDQQLPRELNRLDIKNRAVLSPAAEAQVLGALQDLWPQVDAVLVVDQVSETDCGVVTAKVRRCLQELGDANPHKLILADSRERIGLFRSVWLKPNGRECLQAAAGSDVSAAALALAQTCGRPVFCTCGDEGILVVDPRAGQATLELVPAGKVEGPIDPVGAGDSTSAAIACALVTGAPLEDAAAFGNLVASITIQQLGTTGTASPEMIRRRWGEIEPK